MGVIVPRERHVGFDLRSHLHSRYVRHENLLYDTFHQQFCNGHFNINHRTESSSIDFKDLSISIYLRVAILNDVVLNIQI